MEQPPAVSYTSLQSWMVIGVALILAAAFHTILYGYPMGFPLVIFFLLMLVGVHVLVVMTGKRGNIWAYLFLIPFLLSLVTQATYSSDMAGAISFLLLFLSFTLFVFWFGSSHIRFKEVRKLWSFAVFIESFLPFLRLPGLFVPLTRGTSHWRRILTGILIALPFLILIGLLFVQSDLLLQKTLGGFFIDLFSGEALGRLLVDLFVLVFFLGSGWTLTTRLMEHRRPVWKEQAIQTDAVVVGTFLIMLNLLFLAFIGFQFVYFFGGAAFIQAQGITYANYAREGFFQLLAVSIIVSGIIAALYRFHAVQQRLVRWLSAALILETGFVIASALRRMLLYIDTYGLTVLRYWATVGILLIAFTLAAALIGMLLRVSFSTWSKHVCIAGMIIFAALNVFETEAFIARTNIDRFLTGASHDLDATYIESLSSDAVPELVRLANTPWPTENISWNTQDDDSSGHTGMFTTRTELISDLKTRRINLGDHIADWRHMTLSDSRAMAALSSVQ